MGADQFWTRAKGVNAKRAFEDATTEARYEYGHGGYTGTIAEKQGFQVVKVPPGVDPLTYARQLANDSNHWSDDKWGDAACVELGNNEFIFFGLASS